MLQQAIEREIVCRAKGGERGGTERLATILNFTFLKCRKFAGF